MSTSLSIIVPTYNEEGNVVLLYEQILEVLKQEGVENFELIYVNDGSSDGSFSVIKKLSQNDLRVKYISFEPQHYGSFLGRAVAIN